MPLSPGHFILHTEEFRFACVCVKRRCSSKRRLLREVGKRRDKRFPTHGKRSGDSKPPLIPLTTHLYRCPSGLEVFVPRRLEMSFDRFSFWPKNVASTSASQLQRSQRLYTPGRTMSMLDGCMFPGPWRLGLALSQRVSDADSYCVAAIAP